MSRRRVGEQRERDAAAVGNGLMFAEAFTVIGHSSRASL